MSTLKDKFDNYSPKPDPKVWENINASLTRGVVRRRWMVTTSAVAVSAGAVALFFALNNDGKTMTTATDTGVAVVAENTVNRTSLQSMDVDVDNSVSHSQNVAPDVRTIDRGFSAPQVVSEVSSESAPVVSENVVLPEAVTQPQQTTIPIVDAVADNPAPIVSPAIEPEKPVATEANTDNQKPEARKPENRINPRSLPAELVVWIPNAFSPDDPVEESARTFRVFPNNDASIRSFEIFIYSRSGRLVYHSKDYTQGWDGTANGQKQPMGTYVYVIELNDAAKGLQHTKGSVTLIR